MSRAFRAKRIFITGGSSGVGLSTARLLVRQGASVAICARGAERLAQAASALRAEAAPGQVIRACALDVSDPQAVADVAPRVLAELEGLDLLINNAGVTFPAEAQHTSLAQFREIMEVNYFGTVQVTKAFLPHFIAQRSGTIAGVLSVAGFMGVFGYSAYAASKHALLGFFDTLRQELAPAQVAVSLLMPGDTDTPMLAAENLIKPAATRAVSRRVPVCSAEYVARCFVEGLARGRYHIVPGAHAKLVYYAQRHAPEIVRQVIDRDVRKTSHP
jgi:3-dehydrosphinganine reductase